VQNIHPLSGLADPLNLKQRSEPLVDAALVAEREPALRRVDIKRGQCPYLAEVAFAVDILGPFPRFIERGQQHGSKDGDDGDHDEEFNQRKFLHHYSFPFSACSSCSATWAPTASFPF